MCELLCAQYLVRIQVSDIFFGWLGSEDNTEGDFVFVYVAIFPVKLVDLVTHINVIFPAGQITLVPIRYICLRRRRLSDSR